MRSGRARPLQRLTDASGRTLADAERGRYTPVLGLIFFSLIGVLLSGLLLKRPEFRQTSEDQEANVSSVTPRVETVSRLGYLHAVGGHLEDASGHVFRVRAINWSGLETPQQSLGGLEAEDYGSILAQVKNDGFNVLRIPFSNEMVEAPLIPLRRSYISSARQANEELIGLNSVEILDRVIAKAGSLGLKVILDNHRSEAGSSAEASGLWFTNRFTEAAWIDDWRTLTRRYRNSPAVVGVDLRNEPHNALSGGACWDCEGAHDWRLAAERAGNTVLRINPDLLIIVEGTDTAEGETTWWGGNLAAVRSAPVRLSRPAQLVYSAHVYGPSEYKQPWFTDTTTSAQLWSLWDKEWGFIAESAIAPVLVGEFGMPDQVLASEATHSGSEAQWFTSLLSYFGHHPNLGWAYWTLNAEDPYGWLGAGYSSALLDSWRNRSIRLVISDNTQGNAVAEDRAGVYGEPLSSSLAGEVAVNTGRPQPGGTSSTRPDDPTRPPTKDTNSKLSAESSIDAAMKTEIELATLRALGKQ